MAKDLNFLIDISSWLIIAFILYIFKISNFNPIFCIMICFFINICFVIYALYKNKNFQGLKPIITGMCIKICMITYLLTKTKYGKVDCINGIIFIIIYSIWLYKTHEMTGFSLTKKYMTNVCNIIPNENKIDKIKRINKEKLDELNNDYINNIDEINKNYKNKLKKCEYNFNKKNLDKSNKIYKNKLNKYYNKYYFNLLNI